LSAAAAFDATRELRLGGTAVVAYLGAMRAGALISAIAHAGVVAWVLLGTPKPFDVAAALSRQEVTDFKAHLKKCLKLPAGVDAARDLRVVMRVFLKPDGALASDPMLVAAPAAREGPAMVQAAMQAFKACQPYSFPAEKYNDWKVLDISLSPRDMAGG
jgi:hypothetical protein